MSLGPEALTRRELGIRAGVAIGAGCWPSLLRAQNSQPGMVATQPSAAGPRPGKPVYRIYPLRNGECGISGKVTFKGGNPDETYPFRLYAFLILGGEKPMLVDAGLVDVAEMNKGAAHVLKQPIVQKPEYTIPRQLRKFGLKPEDIGHVFVTHLHFDHVDGLDAFTNATVHIGRKEFEIARQQGGGWAPGRLMDAFENNPQWKRRLSLVEDEEILPGVESFWVGGHTPGSTAYSFNTCVGRTVCTGDTVSLLVNLQRNLPIGVLSDVNEVMAGMQKIRERADFVLPSHEPSNLLRWPPVAPGVPKYTIQAVKVGSCEVRGSVLFHGSGNSETRKLNLYVWAILGGPRPIIVETGPNPKYLPEFEKSTAAYIPGGVRQGPQEQTPAALARLGIKPEDVSHVIVTHAHADHYDYFPLFNNAKLVMNRTEFEQTRSRLNPEVLQEITGQPDRLQLVEDEVIVPGVRAVPLGCHTPGSQGILVRTWIGPAVITGDVAYLYDNIEKNIPGNSGNREACVQALQKTRELADIILPAHDPDTLNRWPDGIIGENPS